MTDYDYFRAPGVAEVLEKLRSNELSIEVASDHDSVEAKFIDPPVALGQLIAFAENREYDVDRDDDQLIWPETGANESEGPWVIMLADHVRDVLAGIPADRVPGLADRWAEIEEFSGMWQPDGLREVVTELIELATEARKAGESLFCHMML